MDISILLSIIGDLEVERRLQNQRIAELEAALAEKETAED